MGGPHVSFLPNEALEFCDAVITGEAEAVWSDVVKDYENNCLKKRYSGKAQENYYDAVHEELLNSPSHVIRNYLETQRGCKFRCTFCTIPTLNKSNVRLKPINQSVELLKKIKDDYKTVTFIDNNVYSDPPYARELFLALKPLNVKWGTQCTIDIAKNDKTLRMAKEAGCVQFLIGYEISGESIEKSQGGKFAMAEKYLEYSKKIKKMGIGIQAQLMYGFEHDRLIDILRIWKFCFKLHPQLSALQFLTPLPGSAFYRQLMKENRITNYNWRYYDCQNPVFRHWNVHHSILYISYIFLRIICALTTGTIGLIIMSMLILIYVLF